jgi:ATPase subunit of ABC transporter with duplicated ATPase domains
MAAASSFVSGIHQVIVASSIAVQFDAQPLFSGVSVKFDGGYRYGLIGANSSGKSTFMKNLRGEQELAAA